MNVRAVVIVVVALSAPSSVPVAASAGALAPIGGGWYDADGEVRAESTTRADTAELAFVIRGPSTKTTPLGNGELRQQVGLKLRAQDTCNVVYVTWHVAPTTGIHVSVKRNPGQSRHAECRDGGYINLRAKQSSEPRVPLAGELHTLRAVLAGATLSVYADEHLVWEGALPAEAFAIEGPIGLRTDNLHASVSLRRRAAR